MRDRSPDPSQCYTVDEACELLSIGKTTFNKLRNLGELETFKSHGMRRIRREAIDAFIEKQVAKERVKFSGRADRNQS